jgi:hypothetical protein
MDAKIPLYYPRCIASTNRVFNGVNPVFTPSLNSCLKCNRLI